MRRFIIISLVALMTIWWQNAYPYNEDNIQTTLYSQINNNRRPDKGNRMPSAPITCFVIFSDEKIEVSTTFPIISYQLWDEDGESLIAAYTSDSQLIQLMMGLNGAYQLRLEADEYTYIGKIEL